MGKIRVMRKALIVFCCTMLILSSCYVFSGEAYGLTSVGKTSWGNALEKSYYSGYSGTGIVYNRETGRYEFIRRGYYDYSYTGPALSKVDGKYYYVERGIVTFTFRGIAYNKVTQRWEFFDKSKANYKYNGVAVSVFNGKKYYVRAGVVDFSFRGIARDKEIGRWVYFSKAKEDRSFTGIARSTYDGQNYFVRNGIVDFKFTGFSWNPDTKTWDYTENGLANYKFKGVAKSVKNGRYYYGNRGKVDFSFTGLAMSQDHGGYIYVRNGEYYPNYTGPSRSSVGNRYYHVENGKWAKSFTGTYTGANGPYKVVKGCIVDSTVKIDGVNKYIDSESRIAVDERIINGRRYLFDNAGNQISKVGIDVSGWNGDINWKKVKNDGVDFAIIRVGGRYAYSGEIYDDGLEKQNLAGANKAGVPVGAYFFTQAISVKEAKEEAAYTLKVIKNYKVDYPVVIDSEWFSGSGGVGRHEKISVATRTKVIKVYCDYVKQAGYTPMIYGSTTWFKDYLDMSKLKDYMVWVAQYADVCEYRGEYRMWQYSSTGKVKGISGDVDMNIWYN